MKIAEVRVNPPVYASENSRKGRGWWGLLTDTVTGGTIFPSNSSPRMRKRMAPLFKNFLNQALVSGDFKPSAGLDVAKRHRH